MTCFCYLGDGGDVYVDICDSAVAACSYIDCSYWISHIFTCLLATGDSSS